MPRALCRHCIEIRWEMSSRTGQDALKVFKDMLLSSKPSIWNSAGLQFESLLFVWFGTMNSTRILLKEMKLE